MDWREVWRGLRNVNFFATHKCYVCVLLSHSFENVERMWSNLKAGSRGMGGKGGEGETSHGFMDSAARVLCENVALLTGYLMDNKRKRRKKTFPSLLPLKWQRMQLAPSTIPVGRNSNWQTLLQLFKAGQFDEKKRLLSWWLHSEIFLTFRFASLGNHSKRMPNVTILNLTTK